MKATTSRVGVRWMSFVLLLCHLMSADATPIDRLILSEVFYDRSGADDGFEWVELFNGSSVPIDLSSWSIGYGGASYANAVVSLSGVIESGGYFVIGGPARDASNANPVLHQVFDFEPDLANSGSIADGIAIFASLASEVLPTTVPSDAVVYGTSNSNSLLGTNGQPSPVHVVDAPSGSSLGRISSDEWSIFDSPTPGSGTFAVAEPLPEPATVLLLIFGIMCIAVARCGGAPRLQLDSGLIEGRRKVLTSGLY